MTMGLSPVWSVWLLSTTRRLKEHLIPDGVMIIEFRMLICEFKTAREASLGDRTVVQRLTKVGTIQPSLLIDKLVFAVSKGTGVAPL